MNITLCTGNRGKLMEVSRILQIPLDSAKLEIDEIQDVDAERVCRRKAAEAFAHLGRPLLVDDTALHLDGLAGFPGALVAWVLESGGPALLHRMLPDGATAAARAVTVIGYADAAGVETFVGELEGTIVAEPRGSAGFGFDTVFVPRGSRSTFAEMSAKEKDDVSPRSLALRRAADFLRARRL